MCVCVSVSLSPLFPPWVACQGHGGSGDGLEDLDSAYHDTETRAFYEQLPDLKAVLPAVLFGEGGGGDSGGGGGGGGGSDSGGGGAGGGGGDRQKADLELLLKRLPNMEGRKEVDELASEIICRGARAHKRLLVRALSTPPVKRPEVVPRYARLAAILTACFKHIGSELTSIILDEFEQSREACANGGKGRAAPLRPHTLDTHIPLPRRAHKVHTVEQREDLWRAQAVGGHLLPRARTDGLFSSGQPPPPPPTRTEESSAVTHTHTHTPS